MIDATDATFEAEVLDSDAARPRGVHGTLVPPVPTRSSRSSSSSGASTRAACASSGSTSTRTSACPSRYGVLSLPTVMLFARGEPVEVIHGAQARRRYADAVSRLLAA